MQDDDFRVVFADRNVVLVPRRLLVCFSRIMLHAASRGLVRSQQDAVTSRAHIRLGSLKGCSGKCNALYGHSCLFAAAAPRAVLSAHVVLLKRGLLF